MKRQKSAGLRIVLVIAAIALGLLTQVVGAFLDKFIWIRPAFPISNQD